MSIVITPAEVKVWIMSRGITRDDLARSLQLHPYKLDKALSRPKFSDAFAARVATMLLRAKRKEVWSLPGDPAFANAIMVDGVEVVDVAIEERKIPVTIAGELHDAARALPLTIGQIREVYNQLGVDLTETEGLIDLATQRAMALIVLRKLSAAATAADAEALPLRRLHQIVQGMLDSVKPDPDRAPVKSPREEGRAP